MKKIYLGDLADKMDVDNAAAEIVENMLLDSEDEMDLTEESDSESDGENSACPDSGYSSISSDNENESMFVDKDPPVCSSPILIADSSDEDTAMKTPVRQFAVSPFQSFALDAPGPFDDYLFKPANDLKTKRRFRKTSAFKPYEKPKAARRLFSKTI